MDDSRESRGQAAYEIYRQHRGESSRFYKGVDLVSWEKLDAKSRETWIAYANDGEQGDEPNE